MTDLSPTQRERLEHYAGMEPMGGEVVAYVSRADRELEERGLVWINGRRIRCTPEGLREADVDLAGGREG